MAKIVIFFKNYRLNGFLMDQKTYLFAFYGELGMKTLIITSGLDLRLFH